MSTGQAIYHKTLGVLNVEEDTQPPKLSWRALEGGKNLDLVLTDLQTLQASKPASGKMAIKLVFGDQSPVFAFRSQQVMDQFKLVFQRIIARLKSKAQDQAKSVELELDPNLSDLDDASLLVNLPLQQLLLKDNSAMMKLFSRAVIKEGLTPEEFWSTRLELLRTFAIQRTQKRGPFNVLSTIKPTASSDNEVNVNVTREKIKEIFIQYPIVKKAYDDQVPKLSEGEFWSRFFSSKLFRSLRGEHVNFHDRGDVIIDKYLQYDLDYDGEEQDEEINGLLEGAGVKIKLFHDSTHKLERAVDLKANDDDISVGKGNKPDITMKSDQDPQLVGILRTMNRLSRRMMDSTENKVDPINLQDGFKDLVEQDRVQFNELHFDPQTQQISATLSMDGAYAVPEMQKIIQGKIDLSVAYDDLRKPIHDVYKEINTIVKTNSKQQDQSQVDIPGAMLEEVKMAHATSVEFLTQFWTKFNQVQRATPQTPNFKQLLIKLRRDYFALGNCIKRLEVQVTNAGSHSSQVSEILSNVLSSVKIAMAKYEDCMVSQP